MQYDCEELQKGLSMLGERATKWHMRFNISKQKVMYAF